MKRLLCIVFLLVFACSFAETHEVIYFFENYCESCDPAGNFAEDYYLLTGESLSDCSYSAYNVITDVGKHMFDETLASLNLESAGLPMVVVDGIVYQGTSEMRSKLAEASLKWGNMTDSTIVYLYTPACEQCAEAEKLLNLLPDTVVSFRGDVSFLSKVNIIRIDVTANPGIADALFDYYSVSDALKVTPSIFLPTHALCGSERIEKYLLRLVTSGQAVGEVKLSMLAQEKKSSGNILTVALSGLVAGFNGCALSMLLLFTSLLLKQGRNTLLYGGCFLLSKFICYFLIGFALLSLLQKLNPTWIVPSARWLLTIIGGFLVLLNLNDAWAAKHYRLDNLRNQLPVVLRTRLRKIIQSLTAKRVLLPASILLGFLVAAGEFLCAGQIYLATLLHSTDSGNVFSLLVYCVAFVLPSVCMLFLLSLGASTVRVSCFLSEHTASVKLLTAVMMLLLIVLSWI